MTDRESTPSQSSWSPPRYVQVRERLRRQITQDLQPGARVPGDAELMARFSVSRVTARHAIADLVAEGLLERRRGSGTYVRVEPVQQQLYHPAGWSAALRETGHLPVTLESTFRRVTADARAAAALGLPPEAEVIALMRVVGTTDGPISIIHNTVAAALLPDLEETGLTGDSMIATLEAHGLVTARVDETVEARGATKAEAAALATTPGAAVLVVAGVVSDPDDRPLLWSTLVSRGDRHRYTASYRSPGTRG